MLNVKLVVHHVTGRLEKVNDKNTKGKTIPLQTWTGPEGSRMLKLSDFKTLGILMR